MTVDEIIGKLSEIPGNMDIRVQSMGGIRGSVSIDDVSVGFDWNHNAVLLHPTQIVKVKDTVEELKQKDMRKLVNEIYVSLSAINRLERIGRTHKAELVRLVERISETLKHR